MLLDDDIVTDGKPEPRAFSRRLRCEKRIEHLFFHLGWNAGAVVANPDFHTITKTFGRGSKGWHVVSAVRFRLAFGRCIEAVRDQIQKRPRDVLRENISFAGSRIKRPLQRDIEALFLGPRAVPGKIEAFLDDGIDINKSVFT